MAKNQLSKSTYLRGIQCDKSLYLYKHSYNLKDPISKSTQAIFDQGNEIGLLAQQLFPNGVDASPPNHFRMIDSVLKTEKFINNGETIIYEATFNFNDVLAALDILVKDGDGWKAYEVKSSTKVSDTYIKDAAIQYYTIINSGIELKDISIVYIDNQYVRNGELKVHDLFKIESVLSDVLDYLPEIPDNINHFKNVILSPEVPKIKIGSHCTIPYDCDFKGTCWKHIPSYSVFDISRLNIKKKFNLYDKGIVTIDEINLDEVTLNANQELQVKSEINQSIHIEKDQLNFYLGKLKYPLYFLDFETFSSGIPLYTKSKPYQQIVFQYSLHFQETSTTELKHNEFLANPNKDPRREFVKRLISDCGENGDILVYNIGFERGILKDLLKIFPEYSIGLNGIINRLKDLMIPFQKKWYYTPEMKGSYSIKNVLPAIVPELSYNNLEIKDGGSASTIFLSIVNGTFKGDVEETKINLKKYCELDTLAMFEILKKLKAID